jgi:hypothetical protein
LFIGPTSVSVPLCTAMVPIFDEEAGQLIPEDLVLPRTSAE